jgi:hypothetical protein
MKNEKTRARFTPRPDDRRPAKAVMDPRAQDGMAVEPPSYDGPPKTDQPAGSGRGRSKEEFVKGRRPRSPKEMTDLTDMKRRRRRSSSGEQPEQYVRLRIRVRGERLSVVDSHLVDGPLSQATAFPGTNAYEVTLDDRLLHAGALPDLGAQRSFVAPDAPEDQRAHHITEREVFEFSARVPAGEVTPETLGDITVRLHRVKGEPRADQLTGEPLDVQFKREMRLVAERRGLPEAALPQAIERRGAHTPRDY